MLPGDRILRGADVGPVPECSFAQHIFFKIKALPKNQVFQVDAETGATQTVYQNLTNSIRLSEGLRKIGLGENDVVVMVCRNSFVADEIVLATWLAGAAIACVNGRMKTGEVKHALELFEPKFIISEEVFVEVVKPALEGQPSATIIITDKDKNSPSSHLCLADIRVDVDVDNYQPLPVTSPSTQLVSIPSSSGTTGLPKGVGITHTNLIFQELNLKKSKIFGHTLPCLQISAFYWVTGIMMYVRCLVSGMKRILIRDATEKNILEAIDRHKPKWTLLAPLFLSSITNHPEFDKYDVSSIEFFILGGTPFLRNIGEKLIPIWGREKLKNTYGTSEATGSVLSSENADDIFALGKPTPGVQVKLVDVVTGETVGPNTTGELCVKSPGIMWGYVNNEKATREAIDYEGWLHTGDLVYYDNSGQVYLVDRIKEMIKIMNMQVSPVEVENTILFLPEVLEVGVTAVTHDGNAYKIKALVVKSEDSSLTEKDICKHVADNLSDYKRLTGGVHFVKSLPKTPTGKLKRKELNQMAQALLTA